jgi:membrane-associated protease RseP (regulator of RpoE activity)
MLPGLINFHQLEGLPDRAFLIPSVVLCSALAMIIHELGHLAAARRCGVAASELSLGFGPSLLGVRIGPIKFSLRVIPLGSFVRLDGTALSQRSVAQQLLVHLGGIIFNLTVALVAYGTLLGWANLLLAAGNLLPLYKHDGWKCGLVFMRALLGKTSQPVEWAFTFSGGFASLIIINALLRFFI